MIRHAITAAVALAIGVCIGLFIAELSGRRQLDEARDKVAALSTAIDGDFEIVNAQSPTGPDVIEIGTGTAHAKEPSFQVGREKLIAAIADTYTIDRKKPGRSGTEIITLPKLDVIVEFSGAPVTSASVLFDGNNPVSTSNAFRVVSLLLKELSVDGSFFARWLENATAKCEPGYEISGGDAKALSWTLSRATIGELDVWMIKLTPER